jgi:response regulator NasT
MKAVRIVVAGESTTSIRSVLERAGMRIVAEAETEEKAIVVAAERAAAAIVHAGTPNAHCGTAFPTIVVGDDADMAAAADLGAFAALPTGVNEAQLGAVVELAVARFADVAALHSEVDSLRDQLETRKAVERAKGILMQRLKLTEQEAYRRLQKASQDENRKMREIAESVIQTERIMSVAPAESSGTSTG